MNVAEVFDEFSQNSYTENISKWVPYYYEMLGSVGNIEITKSDVRKILDIGCGNGNLTKILLEKFSEAEFVLLDASELMLEESKKRFSGRNFNYLNSYFQEAELGRNQIDLAVAVLSLHHLNQKDKMSFYEKVFNALTPGGKFVFSDLCIDKLNPEHDKMLSSWKEVSTSKGTTKDDWEWVMNHYSNFDFPSSLEFHEQALKAAGFSDVSVVWQREKYWTTLISTK